MTGTTTSLQGKRVLIVEDEYFIAMDMKEAFETSGAVVIGPVADADDALSLIESDGSIDGAVLDVNLQGKLVFPVAEALKRLGRPFVFATGYDRSHIPAGFSEVEICEKPIKPSTVGTALFG